MYAGTCGSHQRGERRHGDDGADTEGDDVFNGGTACRQRESREHAKEVRAAGDPMQDAHAEGRVRVAKAAGPGGSRLDMDVVMSERTMLVRARRDIQPTSERPQADANQRDADDAFSPRREDVYRGKQIAEHDRHQCHHDDPRGVTEPPCPSREPATPPILDSKRRDGGEMVRTRKYMEKAGERARQDDWIHEDPILSASQAGSYGPGKIRLFVLADAITGTVPEDGSPARTKMTDWSSLYASIHLRSVSNLGTAGRMRGIHT